MGQLACLYNHFRFAYIYWYIGIKKAWIRSQESSFYGHIWPFRAKSQSGDDKLFTLLGAPNKPVSSANSEPSLAPPHIPKYTKDNLQQILKTVLEVQPLACDHDQETLENASEQTFKSRAPDIYKDQLDIDFYDFIQQYKDHFTMSGSQDRKQVLFPAIFLKERALNRWQ